MMCFYNDMKMIFSIFLIKNKIYDRFKKSFQLPLHRTEISFEQYLYNHTLNVDLLKTLMFQAFVWEYENGFYKKYIHWSSYHDKWYKIVPLYFYILKENKL
jgi:hypothetical protein